MDGKAIDNESATAMPISKVGALVHNTNIRGCFMFKLKMFSPFICHGKRGRFTIQYLCVCVCVRGEGGWHIIIIALIIIAITIIALTASSADVIHGSSPIIRGGRQRPGRRATDHPDLLNPAGPLCSSSSSPSSSSFINFIRRVTP